MSKIIDAVVGDGKTATPAKKYVVYAGIVTFVALVAAIAVLVVSSILFAVRDKAPEEPAGDQQQNTDNTNVSAAIEYANTTADVLKAKIDSATVNVRNSRTPMKNSQYESPIYYAVEKTDLTLAKDAQKQLDAMLVDFYDNNKINTALVPEGKNEGKDCTMPMVCNSNGVTLVLKVCKNDASIVGDKNYDWIFKNAYKYGFIYDGNTFTYVGVAAATYQKMGTLETLVAKLKSATENESVSGTKFQLYYVSAAGEIKVPTNYEYSVIANGTDGYVIVVDMSKKVATPTGGAAG